MRDSLGQFSVTIALLALLLAGCQSLGPPSVKHATVNSTSLKYLEQGRGVPVVMVHGAISDHRIWEAQREPLARTYRYVAFDQRYFGTDPWPDGGSNYSMATHVADLAAFIQSLNQGPVHLVGWSYGSSVALAVAVQHPQLIRSLFLYEPGGASATIIADPEVHKVLAEERKGIAPAMAAAKANDFPAATLRFAEWVNNQEVGANDKRPRQEFAVSLDNARTVPLLLAPSPPTRISCAQLGEIKTPTAVAKGQNTRQTFSLIAEATARCIPGSQLFTVANASHSGPIQNPTGFNEALLGFLAKR